MSNLKLLYEQALMFIEVGSIEGINRERLLLDHPLCNDYDLVHQYYGTGDIEDELGEGEDFPLDEMIKDITDLVEKLRHAISDDREAMYE